MWFRNGPCRMIISSGVIYTNIFTELPTDTRVWWDLSCDILASMFRRYEIDISKTNFLLTQYL